LGLACFPPPYAPTLYRSTQQYNKYLTIHSIKYQLGLIGKEDVQEFGWPGAEVIQSLVRSASGLFIWAATACRSINEGFFPEDRLHMLADGSDRDIAASPEQHLN